MVPQLWFIFTSASSVLRQVVFGRPRFSLSLWDLVDCNFSDGVSILAQHAPNLAPSLPGDDGLHRLSLAPCYEVTVGDGSWPEDALDFPEACRVKG